MLVLHRGCRCSMHPNSKFDRRALLVASYQLCACRVEVRVGLFPKLLLQDRALRDHRHAVPAPRVPLPRVRPARGPRGKSGDSSKLFKLIGAAKHRQRCLSVRPGGWSRTPVKSLLTSSMFSDACSCRGSETRSTAVVPKQFTFVNMYAPDYPPAPPQLLRGRRVVKVGLAG